jgi:hypothetical protein
MSTIRYLSYLVLLIAVVLFISADPTLAQGVSGKAESCN